MVGEVGVGGSNPIRIQSMTNTPTHAAKQTARQIEQLAAAGCEIARLTVPAQPDLEALPRIRELLQEEGITIPLVADIHYSPRLAVAAVPWVDKVRINPGNFGEKKRWDHDLNADEYTRELESLQTRLEPLVRALQLHGRSLRIGTNQGSLSSRILNRWGDTATGMVESALEYVTICEQLDFHDIIISMKSSSPRKMIDAYRLLVKKLAESGRDYPLHLGVTEAGQGADGVIRSAVGIGSLLLDGIGDTIRVSLTDPPVAEIEPARRMIDALADNRSSDADGTSKVQFSSLGRDSSLRRKSSVIQFPGFCIGGDWPPAVSVPRVDYDTPRPEFTLETDDLLTLALPPQEVGDRVIVAAATLDQAEPPAVQGVLEILFSAGLPEEELREFRQLDLPREHTLVAVDTADILRDNRQLAACCEGYPLDIFCGERLDLDAIALAMSCGALLIEGIGDALTLLGDYGEIEPAALAFSILQGAGRRITRAEIISCPSCGRTEFDLLEVTGRVKELTGHLTGVRIAIMGCVVNGPGEMADADFGYVGVGRDKVHLYQAGRLVRRNIPATAGPDQLVALIKECGRWSD